MSTPHALLAVLLIITVLAFVGYLLRHGLEVAKFEATVIEKTVQQDLEALKGGLVADLMTLVNRVSTLEAAVKGQFQDAAAQIRDLEARLNTERSFTALKGPVRK